jgi:hypothetical protein
MDKKILHSIIISFLNILFFMNAFGQISSKDFTHFNIEKPFLPNSWGTGGWTLNDFDNDGDLDITAQRQGNGEIYWFEFINDSTWIRHLIGKDIKSQLGATSHDISKDGYSDLIMGRIWLENPGNLNVQPDQLWKTHIYNGAMASENHDVVVVDLNNDQTADIVCYSQNFGGGTLRWYNTLDSFNWKFFTIDSLISDREKPEFNRGIHAGFAPKGIGDLNGDGYNDIVMPNGWYENPKEDAAGKWRLHRWTEYSLELGIKWTPYGTSFRSWIADIDSDADNDIVITDCDVQMSKGIWLENIDFSTNFVLHKMPFESVESGSFHSLAVIDIDSDGDLDLFSGEQEDPGYVVIDADTAFMKPPNLKERGFFWENVGNKNNPEFELRVIQRDNPGWHDTKFGDVDGDGDLDMITKIWNADEGVWHADYWRNDIKINHDREKDNQSGNHR